MKIKLSDEILKLLDAFAVSRERSLAWAGLQNLGRASLMCGGCGGSCQDTCGGGCQDGCLGGCGDRCSNSAS